jgi:two-component system, OmpR family, osmolarity sensor histidine kinase EnvZ
MARPASLLVRTTLLLALSALAIAGTAILVLNALVIRPIAERSADDEAALLVLSAQTWVELPPESRPYFELELAEHHDLIISSQARDLPPADLSMPYLDLLQAKLAERLGTPVTLMQSDDLIWANVPMGGYTMQIGLSPNRKDIQPLNVGLIIIVIGAAIVFGTSLLIVQRMARPLVRAAQLAETFRGGERFTPLPESGPSELVTLARSFNTMATEIAALLSSRTTLLAGISHDLRTPLARMRLALALLPEDVDRKLVERFERNLTVMDELIGDALRVARGSAEEPQQVELHGYLREIVPGIDDHVVVQWHGPATAHRMVAVGSLRRVLQNLLANARQHGAGVPKLVVHASDKTDAVELRVIDHGRGIPEQLRGAVFQPFFRLDPSRSSATGGSGLGLAIVQQLCNAQGWSIEINEPSGGGTAVVLTICR